MSRVETSRPAAARSEEIDMAEKKTDRQMQSDAKAAPPVKESGAKI